MSDPDYSSVSLLLHCDGTNGSTTFTDDSPSPKTVTANGNAQINTAQSKFGGASAAFDGAGDYLSAPNSTDLQLGSSNFTIEMWVYNATGQGSFALISKGSEWRLNNDSNRWVWSNAPGSSNVFVIGGSVSAATWTHLALVRNGTTTTLYKDGVSVASGTSANVTDSTGALTIGYDGSMPDWNGYVDDIRITKGVARYTADFTPPTEAFPGTPPVTLAGIAAALAYGIAAPYLTLGAAGDQVSSSSGTAASSLSFQSQGQQSALSVGIAQSNLLVSASGLSAFPAQGTFQDVLSGIWFDITGQSSSAQYGSTGVSRSKPIAGAFTELQYGVFGVESTSTAQLTGANIAIAESQFGVITTIRASGITATAVIGAPAFTKIAFLTGRQASSNLGSPTGSLRKGISSDQISLSKQTVWPAIGLKSVAAIASSKGSVGKSGLLVLAGSQIAAEMGDAYPAMQKAITGNLSVFASGGTQKSASIPLTGKGAFPSANPVTFSSSDKTAALNGSLVTSEKGLAYIGADPWYNFIRVLAVDGAPGTKDGQIIVVLEDSHSDITVAQLA